MRPLITGATGFIGRRLAQLLAEPVVVGRSMEKLRRIFPHAEARKWDPSHSLDPTMLMGVDTVYNLAGESVFRGRWNRAKKERILVSRVAATRHLVTAMGRSDNGVKTLINGSAVGYYGSRGSEILTEQSPPGDDFLARVCRAWEKEALRAEAFGTRVVLMRTGVVLGKDGGAFAQMELPFKMGLGGRSGHGQQYMSWIHISDLLSILVWAGEQPGLRGAVNGVAPNPVTNRDFTRALATALHRPALLPLPACLLRAALGEFADVLLGSQRVIPEVLQKSGYLFEHPDIGEALGNIVSGPVPGKGNSPRLRS